MSQLDDAEAPRSGSQNIFSGKTGVSIALVVVIITGIASNLQMMNALDNRQTRYEENLKAQGGDLAEIKEALTLLTSSTQAELRELRKENSNLRERLSRVEVEIGK